MGGVTHMETGQLAGESPDHPPGGAAGPPAASTGPRHGTPAGERLHSLLCDRGSGLSHSVPLVWEAVIAVLPTLHVT